MLTMVVVGEKMIDLEKEGEMKIVEEVVEIVMYLVVVEIGKGKGKIEIVEKEVDLVLHEDEKIT